MPGQWTRLTPFLPQSRAFATKNSCLFPLFVPLCYNLPLCYNVPLCSTVTVLLSFQSVRKVTNNYKHPKRKLGWCILESLTSRFLFKTSFSKTSNGTFDGRSWIPVFLVLVSAKTSLSKSPRINFGTNVKKQKINLTLSAYYLGYMVYLYLRTYIKTPNGRLLGSGNSREPPAAVPVQLGFAEHDFYPPNFLSFYHAPNAMGEGG